MFDFVSAYWEEREAGRGHELGYWLARFPGHEQAIAREFLELETPADAAAATADQGQIGPYLILRELGSGGQGSVYLAQDTRIERTVALKVLSGFFGSVGEERRARLRREAEVIARLDHPGICAIHDAEIETDPPWLAMRHIEGATLAALLAAAKRTAVGGSASAGPAETESGLPRLIARWPARDVLDVHAVLACFEKAARALHAAHEAGVIHRDIKPGNLMISTQCEPVLLDFGLAREEREEEAAALTLEGEMLGTPAYMSPEQLQGGAALDRRTDIYSLGATLYETLTLHRVFEKSGRSELFRAIEREEPRDPREHNPALPAEVAAVLAVALAKEPARRYTSALEFAEDLRRIRVYEPIRARPPGPAMRLVLWTQRNPLLAATILVLAVALGFSLYTLASERAALRVALGRHLGSRANALVNEDPSAAVALGVQACELAPNYLTRAALLSALDACALERELRVPQARTSEDFALDGQGRWIAVALGGYEDGSTRLVLHALNGSAPGVELPGPHGAIQKLLWVEAHQTLLSVEQDGRVRAFDPAQRRLLAEAQLGGALRQWLVSRDGGTLLALTREGRLTTLKLPELANPRVLRERGIDAARLGLGTDSVWICSDGGAQLAELDLRAARELSVRTGPQAGVRSFEVTADALMLATADNRLLRLDLGSGELEPIALANNSLRIEELRLDPRSQRLLVLLARDERGAAFLLDPRTLARTELLPEDSRFALRGAFRGDGARVALACSDMSVRIFDCESGALVQQFRGRFRAQDLAYSTDGSRLYTRNVGGALMCWYASTRPDLLRFRVPGAIERIGWNGARGRFEAFTQDGLRHEFDLASDTPLLSELAPARKRNEQIWELPGGALRQLANHRVVFEPREESGGENGGGVAGKSFELDLSKPNPCSVREVALAPDGSEFVLVTNSLRVLRVRLPDGAVLEELRPFVARSAIYSPDSRHLLLLGEHGGGAFRMLQLDGGGKSRILPSEIIHTADLCLGGFSPDGTVFVTASRDGVVFVRETKGGLPRTQFQAAGIPTALGFESPQGFEKAQGLGSAQGFGKAEGTAGARVLVGTAEGNVHGFPIDPLPALQGRLPRPLEAWEIGNEQRLALPLRYNPRVD